MCGCLLHTFPLGTWPKTQASALTGNETNDPLVCRPVLNPLSHTNQVAILIFNPGKQSRTISCIWLSYFFSFLYFRISHYLHPTTTLIPSPSLITKFLMISLVFFIGYPVVYSWYFCISWLKLNIFWHEYYTEGLCIFHYIILGGEVKIFNFIIA